MRGVPTSAPPPAPAPRSPSGGLARVAARAGSIVAAFGVFLCGWLAMKTNDWWEIVLYTLLAVGAGAIASFFGRQAR